MPRALGFHCIFSMYGFWLPNDPRGSGSDYIAQWELFRYGAATKTNSRRSVAALPHDRQTRLAAKQTLRYPPVEISGQQAVTMAQGFHAAIHEAEYRIHACAILPDHVHLVLGWHARRIREIVGHLKSRATRLLREQGLWLERRPVWGAHGWTVYLYDLAAVERAVAYVEKNPLKEGKRVQRWSMVTPFDISASPATRLKGEMLRRPRKIGGAALRSVQGRCGRV